MLTRAEQETIRRGVIAALAAVSEADHDGPIGMFKEGRAATKALKELPEPLRAAVLSDPTGPEADPDPTTDSLETDLQAALDVVRDRTPEAAGTFCSVVSSACAAVAAASHGVSPSEAAALERIRAVLG